MPQTPQTRASLLVRLRAHDDHEAWRQFVDLYGPLIYRFGRKSGLQDADAADLTQIALHAVSAAVANFDYDPARGTFRSWLFTIVRRQLCRWRERDRRQPRGAGDSAAQELLAAQPAPDDEAARWWDEEYRRQQFLWAAARVRCEFQEATWQAFWLTATEGKSAAEAGAALGMTVGAVYTAKSRVLDRIKKEIELVEED